MQIMQNSRAQSCAGILRSCRIDASKTGHTDNERIFTSVQYSNNEYASKTGLVQISRSLNWLRQNWNNRSCQRGESSPGLTVQFWSVTRGVTNWNALTLIERFVRSAPQPDKLTFRPQNRIFLDCYSMANREIHEKHDKSIWFFAFRDFRDTKIKLSFLIVDCCRMSYRTTQKWVLIAFPNLWGTAAELKGRVCVLFTPLLPDVTITHTQTGLSGGIPQNWG